MSNQAFLSKIESLAKAFADHAGQHDADRRFVADDYRRLREEKVFSATVPADLGGGGISHRTMCAALRTLGRHASSTALALSMHQHLVAFQVFNHLHAKPGRVLLEKVAAQELVLVSTGANDWLSSNGTLKKVEGGFRLTAKKPFASGSVGGDLLITSAVYEDPEQGSQVLHFPVSLKADGVHVEDDWHTLGMCGTGSNTVSLIDVFVPEETVALRRPQNTFHPVFNVICTVAMPYIMSAYVGVAEAAAEAARRAAKKRPADPHLPYLLGEMENALATAQLACDSMVELANDWNFEPTPDRTSAILIRKTITANACLATAEKALESAGGAGFYRANGLERLLRDVHGAQFHPLQEKRQHAFTGRLAIGLPPMPN